VSTNMADEMMNYQFEHMQKKIEQRDLTINTNIKQILALQEVCNVQRMEIEALKVERDRLKALLFTAQKVMGTANPPCTQEFHLAYQEIHGLFYYFDKETEDFALREAETE